VDCNDPLKQDNVCPETSEGAAHAFATLDQVVHEELSI
jgi:hypothetical protein